MSANREADVDEVVELGRQGIATSSLQQEVNATDILVLVADGSLFVSHVRPQERTDPGDKGV